MTQPSTFRLIDWPMPPMEHVDPLGEYAEAYWLPVLRPAAFVLGRRLVSIFAMAETVTLDASALATTLGIINSHAVEIGQDGLRLYHSAAKRLARYKLVRWGPGTCEVRERWPRLPSGLLASLPPQMQSAEPLLADAGWVCGGTPRGVVSKS